MLISAVNIVAVLKENNPDYVQHSETVESIQDRSVEIISAVRKLIASHVDVAFDANLSLSSSKVCFSDGIEPAIDNKSEESGSEVDLRFHVPHLPPNYDRLEVGETKILPKSKRQKLTLESVCVWESDAVETIDSSDEDEEQSHAYSWQISPRRKNPLLALATLGIYAA